MLTIPGHKGKANQKHLRFYLTLVRMANIKNNNNKCWVRMQEKRNPRRLLVGMEASATTLENNMEAS
jgi:hypothetical protein